MSAIFSHIDNLRDQERQLTRSIWTLLAIGSVASIGSFWVQSHTGKLLANTVGLACGATALASDRARRKLETVTQTADLAVATGTINALQHALAPSRIESAIALPAQTAGPLPQADWWHEALDARLLLICGPQGSGKTSLALRLLADRASRGHAVTVLDPHAAAGQWPYKTIGAGKDYVAIDGAIGEWVQGVIDHYKAIAIDANAPVPAPQTLVAEELTQWANEVELAPKMVRAACSDIRKAKRYLVALSHGRTLATIGGAKGYRDTIDNAAMVVELDRAADERGATTGKLYRPGQPNEPVAIGIDRWQPQPAIAPVPQAAALPGPDDRVAQLDWLSRCWGAEDAIEVGHETIAREVEIPVCQQELIDQIVNLSKQKGAVSAAACQRSSRKLKALTPDQIRELFWVAQALGKGTVDGDGSSARFTASE
jgi:hypothetical protein